MLFGWVGETLHAGRDLLQVSFGGEKVYPKRKGATGSAESNAAGKLCRSQAYTAYPDILSACL